MAIGIGEVHFAKCKEFGEMLTISLTIVSLGLTLTYGYWHQSGKLCEL